MLQKHLLRNVDVVAPRNKTEDLRERIHIETLMYLLQLKLPFFSVNFGALVYQSTEGPQAKSYRTNQFCRNGLPLARLYLISPTQTLLVFAHC